MVSTMSAWTSRWNSDLAIVRYRVSAEPPGFSLRTDTRSTLIHSEAVQDAPSLAAARPSLRGIICTSSASASRSRKSQFRSLALRDHPVNAQWVAAITAANLSAYSDQPPSSSETAAFHPYATEFHSNGGFLPHECSVVCISKGRSAGGAQHSSLERLPGLNATPSAGSYLRAASILSDCVRVDQSDRVVISHQSELKIAIESASHASASARQSMQHDSAGVHAIGALRFQRGKRILAADTDLCGKRQCGVYGKLSNVDTDDVRPDDDGDQRI